jgi:integrase/recombinase XerD
VMSADEARRLLAVADSLRTRLLLSRAYGCGLRASEVVRLKVKHINSAQRIIRVEQGKGRKDRNVILSPELLDLLREWRTIQFSFSRSPSQSRKQGTSSSHAQSAGLLHQ